MISRFADSLLSREDLKRVKGGYGNSCIPAHYYTYNLDNGQILIQHTPGTSFQRAFHSGIEYSSQTGTNIGTRYFYGTCY